jgi:hypothetical protein
LPALPSFGSRGASAAAGAARAAQRRYELARRRLLPPYPGVRAARCEVNIGRLCYWDNNGDARPPAESPAARRARRALLDELSAAAAADSSSDWIAGQRVRYLLEAARAESDSAADALGAGRAGAAALPPPAPGWRAADSAAAACRGTPWWCRALAGLAAHAAGRHQAAGAAFDSARALLPDAAARCAWDDLGPWLPPRALGAYRRLACGSAERARFERRAWRLAAPFWTLDPAGAAVNDLRTELAARRTLVRLHAAGEHPQALPWGADLTESDLRYGVPTAWSVRDPIGVDGVPSIVGHEPTPSYDFWPGARALAPERLLAPAPPLPEGDAWDLRRYAPQMRYAPAYAAAGVYALPHQLARFRRADTLVVVGTYDARDRGDSVPPGTGTGPVRAGLVLDDLRASAPPATATATRDGAGREGGLVARVVQDAAAAAPGDTAARWLAAVETFDALAVRFADGRVRRGRAGRARALVAPLPPGAGLSDLLIVRPGLAALPAPTLAAATDSAAGAAEARAGAPLGVYWEQYDDDGRAPAARAADTVVVSVTRLDPSLRERLGAVVGRPLLLGAVRARYAVAPGAGGVTGRAVVLTLPDVPPGAYRLEVTRPAEVGARRPRVRWCCEYGGSGARQRSGRHRAGVSAACVADCGVACDQKPKRTTGLVFREALTSARSDVAPPIGTRAMVSTTGVPRFRLPNTRSHAPGLFSRHVTREVKNRLGRPGDGVPNSMFAPAPRRP